MVKESKLTQLEKSLEKGTITPKEFEEAKKKLEDQPDQQKQKEEDLPKPALSSDKMLVLGIVGVIILFGGFFGYIIYTKEPPKTIEDLHVDNIEGDLNEENGYLYKGVHSFVKIDDVWYTQFTSPRGNNIYNLNFRYSPKDVEDIDIQGVLDFEKFNNATEYFVTFNPIGDDFAHLRVARLDFDNQMIPIFEKTPKSACDRNETTACEGLPIITCDNTEEIVVYFKDAEQPSVVYDDNCIIISGKEFDLVKGVDRVLYNFYNIMNQVE